MMIAAGAVADLVVGDAAAVGGAAAALISAAERQHIAISGVVSVN